MPLFARPARVLPYFGYRSAERLVLTARALRNPAPNWDRQRPFGKIATMIAQFAPAEIPLLPVTLELAVEGEEPLIVRQLSDRDGFVRFAVGFRRRRELPSDPVWEVAQLRWPTIRGVRSTEAYILAPGRSGKLAVISDIDDTIIETGAGDLARNWRRLVAQMPDERAVVPGAVKFYGHLGGGSLGERVPASRRPFFYVSSSPWNLFDYLVAFQQEHGLPQGPLLLRKWGFNRATLGRGSHGAHKARAVRELTEFYPELRFALIGDDTQADAVAFAEAVAAHPGRIAAVFIRRAPDAGIEPAEQAALDSIIAAGVPLWCGESFEIGADFLASLGFTANGETAEIVKTIETAKEAAAASPAAAR